MKVNDEVEQAYRQGYLMGLNGHMYHGRWRVGLFRMRCDICGQNVPIVRNYAFCPRCGAKMDRGEHR